MATTILAPLMTMTMFMPIGVNIVVGTIDDHAQLSEMSTFQLYANPTATDAVGATGDAACSVSLRPVNMAESVAASSTTPMQLTAITSVAELLAAFSFAGPVSEQYIEDRAAASGAGTGNVTASRAVAEAVRARATFAPSALLTVFTNETGQAETVFSFKSILSAMLKDGAAVMVSVSIGGEVFTCWCTNAENLASSEYRGYNFNSLCALGGKYYAAGEGGIYLLEGDTDAGVPINASLLTGLMDFGSVALKHVPAGYISRMANGDMHIAIVTVTEGRKQVNNYAVTGAVADSYRTARVPFGKGLRARYWQLELSNVGGADFAVDEMAMTPAISMRRI